jgi:small subunit ribosomal protein S5
MPESNRRAARLRRHRRVRKHMVGTSERPRLNVFRSLRHIYAQVIDDSREHTLVSASTVDEEVQAQLGGLSKTEQARVVGKVLAERALGQGIEQVVFDRGGYKYHGQNGGRMTGSFRDREVFTEREELDERVVDITRVAKVVKGGRRFGFRVVAVVGDNRGQVGMGVGKARAVPDAIRKATERARRDMQPVAMVQTTIPHEVVGTCGGARVLIKPATPGTGVIAAGGVRAVLEAVGVTDVLTKSQGSSNMLNVVRATMDGLRRLRRVEDVARERGVPEVSVMPFWRRGR